MGLAFIEMQTKAFDITENRIGSLITQLSQLNAVNKDLSDFINALTAVKGRDHKKDEAIADFIDDEGITQIIDRLYEMDPKIFPDGEKRYYWKTEKEVDILLSALDAAVKTKIAEVNQVTMFINVRFDERVQYSENARKVLEMLIRHIESIISKYKKN